MQQHFELMYFADFYKVSHKAQYSETVTHVSSTLVARGAKYNPNISEDHFYWFGVKYFLEKLQSFEDWFFSIDHLELASVLAEYQTFLETRLPGKQDVSHWAALHSECSFLPVTIYAQEERQWVDFQTPVVVVENTMEGFGWLVGFIETSMLSNVWGITTAANRAKHIRGTIESFMEGYTEEELAAVDFMGHDFSYRGMMGDEAATLAGMGHLSVFKGSDTVPAARAMERIYGEVTGFSVPATEHSVMCAGGKETEEDTYNRILDIYPEGIVSIVSDTWDYFKVLTETVPNLKGRIMARDGKVVIRPDSGNPVDIICGHDIPEFDTDLYPDVESAASEAVLDAPWDEDQLNTFVFKYDGKFYEVDYDSYTDYGPMYYNMPVGKSRETTLTPEQRGSLELLEDTFGCTRDSAGLKLLDSHIGLIYGDGMNQERVREMLTRMVNKGYSPLNIVFGIGAYTYQFMTRDELGWAFKATAVKDNGEWVSIQKDPKTDPGKKSLTGRQSVESLVQVF